MPRFISCVAGAWFLIAPWTAFAAPALSSDANAGSQSAQLYAQNQAKPKPPPGSQMPVPQGTPQVYLLRGLMNVFSLGMDDLANRLQAAGIPATVMNHADSDYVASRIMTTYNSGNHGPIVLIGHSLGADAVAEIANTLAHYNIPVSLLVLYDGTDGHMIPPTVATAINYTKHFMISPAPGSRGIVQNVDLSGNPAIDHLNIDTAPSLQSQTVNSIIQLASAASRPPAATRRQ